MWYVCMHRLMTHIHTKKWSQSEFVHTVLLVRFWHVSLCSPHDSLAPVKNEKHIVMALWKLAKRTNRSSLDLQFQFCLVLVYLKICLFFFTSCFIPLVWHEMYHTCTSTFIFDRFALLHWNLNFFSFGYFFQFNFLNRIKLEKKKKNNVDIGLISIFSSFYCTILMLFNVKVELCWIQIQFGWWNLWQRSAAAIFLGFLIKQQWQRWQKYETFFNFILNSYWNPCRQSSPSSEGQCEITI